MKQWKQKKSLSVKNLETCVNLYQKVEFYLKAAVFWDVAPCSLVDIDRRFRGAEAVSSSETSVNIDETTRRNIPEDNHLHKCHRENLRSQLSFICRI
jgi:hypothetical protein